MIVEKSLPGARQCQMMRLCVCFLHDNAIREISEDFTNEQTVAEDIQNPEAGLLKDAHCTQVVTRKQERTTWSKYINCPHKHRKYSQK